MRRSGYPISWCGNLLSRNMNRGMTIRLSAFALAIAAVLALVVWGAQAGWKRMGQLNSQFTRVRIESFNIADRFQASTILKSPQLNTQIVARTS